MTGTALFGDFGGLHPAYVRGLAYLKAHRESEAAMEFQKLLDHPGIVLAHLIGVLARLQLARIFARSGNPARAKVAFQDVLSIWKDADPDIPVIKQAQAESARLQ